jgi:hypothetical protein
MKTPGPRLFGIPAIEAPIVAVIRRGPSKWCQVGRWDIGEDHFEPGAWIRGTIYPQKCDVSPDGRWFAASILKPNTDWPAGDIYEAVSRLPWLDALAAWEAGTTYTRGIHFADEPGDSILGEPDVGDAAPILAKYRLDLYRPTQFAVERRRGWAESGGTPPRDQRGPWDEREGVTLEKRQPGGSLTLLVAGGFAGHRTSPDWYGPAEYALSDGAELTMLDGVQWADWDRSGRLLVATADGRLQIRTLGDGHTSVVFEEDLAPLRPDPQPAPPWATEF